MPRIDWSRNVKVVRITHTQFLQLLEDGYERTTAIHETPEGEIFDIENHRRWMRVMVVIK